MLEVAVVVQAVSDIEAGVPGGPWDGRCCCSDCCGSALLSVQVRHNNASALLELCAHAAILHNSNQQTSGNVHTPGGRGVAVLPCHPDKLP